MQVKNRGIYVMLVVVGFVVGMVAENFVTESKKRPVKSVTNLKKDIGEGFADCAHLLAQVIQQEGGAQEKILQRLRELFSNDKKSCFVNATAVQLQAYVDHIEQMKKLLEEVNEDLKKFNTFLTTGCASSIKTKQKDANGSV